MFLSNTSFSQSKVLSNIPKTAKNIQSFIPEGYDTLMVTKGDLNNDNEKDIVLVLFNEIEKKDLQNTNVDSIPGRLFIILFKKNNDYHLAAASSSIILCKYCGGVMGDPFQEVTIDKGVIVAARHIHMHTSDAESFGVKDKETVSVKVEGKRGLIFDNVLVRVHEDYALEMHVDIDEGNAASLKNGSMLKLLK